VIEVQDTPLSGLRIVQPRVLGDSRGFFVERFHAEQFERAGLPVVFAQDNHSRSAPGVLRGLHYQNDPPQGKLVGVIRGRVWDVALDIRPDSPTFGEHFGVELSGQGGNLFWIPPGFAHGFCVLGDEPADMLYKVTGPYNEDGEGGIRFNDPDLAVLWPIDPAVATISDRDRNLPPWSRFREDPPRW
jgi:dTDP-4-dehydrorhamnose 3,5-epimerase